MPSTHSSTTLKVKLQTHNFHGLTGTSLGVDNIDVTLDAAPAQIFAASLPLSIASGSLGAGSGVLETPGAGDFYDFQLTEQQAAKGLVLESECSTAGWVKLRDLASGRILSPEFTSCSSARYSGLTDGPFRLEVISNGAAGAYHASVFVQPDAESFDYSLGHKVEPGKIGGVDVVGAGKLETSASKDVYTFTVPEGGQSVVFDADQYSWPLYYGSKLVQVSDGKNWGTINGHHAFDLPAGDYRIEVERPGEGGTYWFTSFLKPGTQSFGYEVGQKVESGKIGGVAVEGAGNLETSASKDVYSLTVPEGGQTVVFDADQYSWPLYYGSKLVQVSDGKNWGTINGHHEWALPAGDYRIEVERPGEGGTYWFTSFLKPAVQEFSLSLGQKVEPGKIGGVDVVGAGNLETSASKDVYTFTVPEGGQSVVFDADRYSWPLYYGSKLVQVSDGKNWGTINGHHAFDLPAGDYRIEVERPGEGGTHWFATTARSTPQTFAYDVGQKVEPGKIGGVALEGAGNLETTTAKDVYTFTVPEGGQSVVFDADQYSWPLYYGSKLVQVSDGKNWGTINGHHEWALPAGDYRIEVERPGEGGTYWFTSFLKPGTQSFGYEVGQKVESGKIGGVAVEGAGNLETSASKDVYSLTVPEGGQTVVFDADQYSWPLYYGSKLVQVSDGKNWGTINGHHEWALPAGDYRIEVERPGEGGTYWFTSFLKPAVQEFSLSLGQKVEPGKIGGVDVVGAGNLETSASKDVYTFTVPEGGQSVVFDADRYSWPLYYGSKLVQVSDGKNWGTINGHHALALPAGDYRIEVERPGEGGTYWFTSFLKPGTQSFGYEVGQKVESGKIGGVAVEGAGNLETSASKDVYSLTVPEGGQTVVFDADQYSWPLYYGSKLVQVSDGKNWGTINGHHEWALPAGDYRIEVERPGEGGTYWFTSFLKPAVQEFSLSLGQKVEPGKIGGVDVVGAGNLETSASKDVYTFTVPEGGQSVVFDADQYSWPLYYGSKLVQVSDGKNWGTINGHHAFDLPAGDYRIEVERPGEGGTYWFTSSVP